MSAANTPESGDTLEEVLAAATAGRCANCLRPLATDDDWANTFGGERPDLCWEPWPQACPWVPQITAAALQAAAVREWLRISTPPGSPT